jgi:hypothetical protein
VSGVDLSNDEIAAFIGTNRSLGEFNTTMTEWENFKRWGPTVRSVFEERLGERISDDRVFALLSGRIPTPELDRAFEDALYRGRPAILGIGLRPQEEAEMLRRFGIDVDQAFRGYQGIVAEMPRAERYAAIEKQIGGTSNLPANGSALFNDTPFATLFRAIQLGDPEAIRMIQEQMSREIARFQTGGGPAASGTATPGLLTSAERKAG